jgi:hypothetical protein
MHLSLAWSFVSLGFSGFEMERCLMSQGLRRLQSCFSGTSRSTIHVFYILPAQYIQSQASVLHLPSDHLTCRQLKLQPDAPPLIVPDSLLPSLALGSLPFLPLLLLTPPLPLLLPHRAIKLALLLRPPRRPYTQRPSNHPPGNRSRLLGPLVQPPRVGGAHTAVEARAPGAVGRIVWEVEGGW